ncbi:MAG TPA: MFS transporter [Solirubrobacteraceae bacterium]
MTTPSVGARVGVLAARDFRLVFAGQALSTLGDAMATIAVAFAVLEIGGSPGALGAVLVARYAPLAVFLLIGGVVADRVRRRRLMLISDALRVLAQGTLAALLLSGNAELWQIVLLQAVHGTAEAFFSPALAGLLPQIVNARRLPQANALLRMTFDLSLIVGPGLGALLVAQFHAGGAVAADAATFAVSALLLARLRPTREARSQSRRIRLVADLRDGWFQVRSRSWLWISIVNFMLFGALAMPAILVLGPELARTELGGIGTWSILTGAFGAGALAGSILSLRIRFRRPAVAMAVLLAIAAARPAAFASGFGLPLIAAFSLLAGAAMSTATVLWIGLLQQQVPAEALSRVDSIDSFGTFLLMPLGYLAAGPLAATVGIHLGMVLLGALPLLVSVATLASSQLRKLGWLDEPMKRNLDGEREQRLPVGEPLLEPAV